MDSKNVKIVVYVPESHADAVRTAMGDAGAGRIGKYSHCSFTTKGIGRFKPLDGAKTYIGEVGKSEEVAEERIEMTCPRGLAKKVIEAMKKVHPYEEVVYDVDVLDEI